MALSVVRASFLDLRDRFGTLASRCNDPSFDPARVVIAIHEAGHALVALRFGLPVERVALDSAEPGTRAECVYGLQDAPRFGAGQEEKIWWAMRRLAVTLGGPLAEEQLSSDVRDAAVGFLQWQGYHNSDEAAIAEALTISRCIDRTRTRAQMAATVRGWLQEDLWELDATAAALLRQGSLRSDDLHRTAPVASARFGARNGIAA
jgi:hypothetical protein